MPQEIATITNRQSLYTANILQHNTCLKLERTQLSKWETEIWHTVLIFLDWWLDLGSASTPRNGDSSMKSLHKLKSFSVHQGNIQKPGNSSHKSQEQRPTLSVPTTKTTFSFIPTEVHSSLISTSVKAVITFVTNNNSEMVTIHIKKTSDFETRPEFQVPHQARNCMEHLVTNSPDTPATNYLPGYFRGSYLSQTAGSLKANNLSAQKFEETQKGDEGNSILETKIQILPHCLIIGVNLQEIGIVEGRGSFKIEPTQNGFWLYAQELDYYKDSLKEEAHTMQRTIARNYTINGQYDWQNLHQTTLPDGSLLVTIGMQSHPRFLAFPSVNRGPLYSSLAENPGFPPVDPSLTFGKSILRSSTPVQCSTKCCQCGGVKSVGLQTDSSLRALPCDMESYSSVQTQTPSSTAPSSNFGSYWLSCTCDSMDCD